MSDKEHERLKCLGAWIRFLPNLIVFVWFYCFTKIVHWISHRHD